MQQFDEKKFKEVELQMRFLSSMLDVVEDQMAVVNRDYVYEFANEAYLNRVGYGKEEVLGRTIADILGEKEFAEIKDAVDAAFSGKIQHYQRKRYATRAWHDVQYSPFISPYDGEARVVAIVREISELIHREQQLEQSKQILTEVQSIAHIGHWELADSDDTLYWSDEVYTIFGVDKKNFVPHLEAFLSIIHPDDRDELLSKYNKSIDEKRDYFFQHRITTSDGETRYLEERGRHFYTEDGKFIKTLGTAYDVTEIMRSHERLLTILNGIDAIIYVSDMETYEVLFINEFAKKDLGDIEGKTCWQTIQKDQKGPCSFCTNKKLVDDSGEPAGVVRWQFQNTGNQRIYDILDRAIYWSDGRLVRLEIAYDITERTRLQEDLQSEKQKLEDMFHEHSAVMLLIDRENEGRISDVNDAACKYYGYERGELIGMKIGDINALTEEEVKQEMSRAASLNKNYFNFRHILKSGEIRDVEVHSTPIHAEGKVFLFSIIHDITEVVHYRKSLEDMVESEIAKRREKEQMLIHQSRVATLGEMVGTVAHQWKQPLTSLSLELANIQDDFELGQIDNTDVQKRLNKAQEVIRYMSQTVEDFRRLFRVSHTKEKFSLLQSTIAALKIFDAQLRSRDIETHFSFHEKNSVPREISLEENPETYPSVEVIGFSSEYQQVVMNLLSNARDAILERKKMESTFHGELSLSIEVTGNTAKLIVEDNGQGIPRELGDKIFDAYFTTKDTDAGTGIGLYMSRTIVEKNLGGRIYFDDIPQGARFTLEIPLGIQPVP